MQNMFYLLQKWTKHLVKRNFRNVRIRNERTFLEFFFVYFCIILNFHVQQTNYVSNFNSKLLVHKILIKLSNNIFVGFRFKVNQAV